MPGRRSLYAITMITLLVTVTRRRLSGVRGAQRERELNCLSDGCGGRAGSWGLRWQFNGSMVLSYDPCSRPWSPQDPDVVARFEPLQHFRAGR